MKVVLAAGDTFRAAAIEQLKIWGERIGRRVVAAQPAADAAGLAFDALERARATKADVLLIDTAGPPAEQSRPDGRTGKDRPRHQEAGCERAACRAAGARCDDRTERDLASGSLQDAVPLTGLVMTKLDGTAKGGILVALAAKFGLPIHFIGVGEGEDDLQPFDAANFANALTGAA